MESGLQLMRTALVESKLQYETPEEAVGLARTRPFSPFHFFTRDAFEKGLDDYEQALRGAFGRGPVENFAQMSLFVAVKNSCTETTPITQEVKRNAY